MACGKIWRWMELAHKITKSWLPGIGFICKDHFGFISETQKGGGPRDVACPQGYSWFNEKLKGRAVLRFQQIIQLHMFWVQYVLKVSFTSAYLCGVRLHRKPLLKKISSAASASCRWLCHEAVKNTFLSTFKWNLKGRQLTIENVSCRVYILPICLKIRGSPAASE